MRANERWASRDEDRLEYRAALPRDRPIGPIDLPPHETVVNVASPQYWFELPKTWRVIHESLPWDWYGGTATIVLSGRRQGSKYLH